MQTSQLGGDNLAEAAEAAAPATAPSPQELDQVRKVLVDAHAGPSQPSASQRLIAEETDVDGEDDVDDDDGRFADADEDEGGPADTVIHFAHQDHVQLMEIEAACRVVKLHCAERSRQYAWS